MKENNNIQKNEISKFIGSDVFEIIAKKENWLSKVVYSSEIRYRCEYCKEKIEDVKYPDYFHLWDKKDEKFITFHFECMFGELNGQLIIRILTGSTKGFHLWDERLDELEKIFTNFNYRYDFETNLCY